MLKYLLIFVPVAILLRYLSPSSHMLIFVAACFAIVPLAGWLGRATEELAHNTNEGIGGLLNATFGNAAELIIAIAAIQKGLYQVVKASLTGSVIGNLLLVLGAAIFAGGIKYPRQRFNAVAAHLIFSLYTHKHLFECIPEERGKAAWGVRKSILVLLGSTALIAWVSEILVGSVEQAAATLGMTRVFIGVIVVAVVGNAAEHSTAVMVAMKNRMELSIGIAIGSSLQIALFVAPILVALSYFMGPQPMDLVFTPAEVLAIFLSVLISGLIASDGESNWLEGVLLLAVYLILGIVFFYLPDVPGAH